MRIAVAVLPPNRSTVLRSALLAALILAAALRPAAAAGAGAAVVAAPAEETWEGALQTGGPLLHLVLHLAPAPDGTLKASIDSIDQGAYGIAVATAVEKDATLRLDLPGIGASFEGHVTAGRKTIDGIWSQGGARMPLLFARRTASAPAGQAVAPAAPADHPAATPAPGTAAAAPGAPSPVDGIWQGTLEAAGVRLRLQLHVYAGGDGQFTGRLDSLDQGSNGLACAHITLLDRAFHFEVPAVAGSFDGTLNAAHDELAGTWTQHDTPRPLTFRRGEQPAAQRRPQTPAKPYPYREEEVTYPNAKAATTLAATLTLPPGAGPFPAALLIAGSGPQTRDEVVAGHAVFQVLADSLTRKGIAVLRADKRGIGKSIGDYAHATTADFADDAEAGIAYLRKRHEIDAAQIGLVGHSEGGLVAPLVASRSNVAWIVILAGDAMKGDDLLVLQGRRIAQAAGAGAEGLAAEAAIQHKSFAIVLQEKDADAALPKLAALFDADPAAKALTPDARQANVRILNSPWMRFFLAYDPVPALRQTRCPVLALYGSKDLQVPPAENLPLLKAALAAAGNHDVEIDELPGLNHLFQHAGSGAPTEYGTIEETFAPEALDKISTWILQHAAARRTAAAS